MIRPDQLIKSLVVSFLAMKLFWGCESPPPPAPAPTPKPVAEPAPNPVPVVVIPPSPPKAVAIHSVTYDRDQMIVKWQASSETDFDSYTWMNRRIRGSQRRVWWPKGTPASNSCLSVTTAMPCAPFPSVGLAPTLRPGATVGWWGWELSGRYLPCRAPGSLPAKRFNLSFRSPGSPSNGTDMSRRLCAVSINSTAGAAIRAGGDRPDGRQALRPGPDGLGIPGWVAMQTVSASMGSSS